MSVIIVYIEGDHISANGIMELKNATDRSLNEIRSAFSNQHPLIECEIFDVEYEANARMLRDVSAVLVQYSLPHQVYELPEGESIESFNDRNLADYQISLEILDNILDEADVEVDRQLGM